MVIVQRASDASKRLRMLIAYAISNDCLKYNHLSPIPWTTLEKDHSPKLALHIVDARTFIVHRTQERIFDEQYCILELIYLLFCKYPVRRHTRRDSSCRRGP